jgi:hypothetical protein
MNEYLLFGLLLALYTLTLGLMQLGNWSMKRRWRIIARHLDNRHVARILRDFVLAFEDGNDPEVMVSVHDKAVTFLDRLAAGASK